MSAEERWTVADLRDEVWRAKLCPSHKLLMLGVLSFMGRERLVAYPGLSQLSKRTGMSRTKVSRLCKDLVVYDWLVPGAGIEYMPRPGRRPVCFFTPRRDVLPEVPEHCLKPSKIHNLKRSPQ